MSVAEELIDFISRSPVSYQAAANAGALLEKEGFVRLYESERWKIMEGRSYYVLRNDSAIIAFTVPENFSGIRICASHSDSPYFKIKENPQINKEGYCLLNVEKYGGMLMSPWFDRPLSVAGRLCVQNPDGSIRSVLVDFDQDMLIIPSLAIHMNRAVNDGVKLSIQNNMLPLYGLSANVGSFASSGKSAGLLDRAAHLAGVSTESVLGSDLYVYNHQKGSIWGPDNEFISAPRLDNLQCLFTTLKGFIAGDKKKHLSIFAAFDNEEVGSSTRQGAASTFLMDTLRRIYMSLGRSYEDYLIDLSDGFMLSADNAHAVHPSFSSKADPVNRPLIGNGVVLKFAGNQKYCTDGISAALFRALCRKADCPVQVFTNHSDILGGSTLGNISNNKVAMPTADIGIAQLAMHSPYETAGVSDCRDMVKINQVFFE